MLFDIVYKLAPVPFSRYVEGERENVNYEETFSAIHRANPFGLLKEY